VEALIVTVGGILVAVIGGIYRLMDGKIKDVNKKIDSEVKSVNEKIDAMKETAVLDRREVDENMDKIKENYISRFEGIRESIANLAKEVATGFARIETKLEGKFGK